MAEAVAALSLAANILQVAEFGRSFFVTGWKLWRGGIEALDGFSTLQVLAENLKDVSKHLLAVPAPSPGTQLESNNGIFALAGECSRLAQEVVSIADKIGQTAVGRKRDATTASFRLAWKAKDIKSIEERLDRIKAQLTLNLALSLREYAMQSLQTQESILKALQRSEDADGTTFQPRERVPFGVAVVQCLTRGWEGGTSGTISSLNMALQNQDGGILNGVSQSTFRLTESYYAQARSMVMASLSYNGMNDRAETIADAHQQTFSWIFGGEHSSTQPAAGFTQWLVSDEQLYWITGKPGSGKSTLIKFISQPAQNATPAASHDAREFNQARCMPLLRKWSCGKPLVLARFYFWASGATIQITKGGLYRTLLSQILTQFPEMIPPIFPDRWQSLCIFGLLSPLSDNELRAGLFRLVQLLSPTTKICLFIDGLDEFEGDPADLVDLVNEMIRHTSVKICVSSRPWLVFEDAMKSRPSLRVEDLTSNDIKSYIESHLHGDDNFALLVRQESQFANILVERIVEKASGVFLWVKLVVSSLLQGMRYGDRVLDLQRRLDSLPQDLEDLYGRILDTLDPFYFEHACQYFTLMAASPEPPPALVLSFADEADQDFAINLSSEGIWSSSEIETRIEQLRRRLGSRCRGLVEICRDNPNPGVMNTPLQRPTVQYLHKTVKDYLEIEEVRDLVKRGLKNPFDGHLRLCSATLALYKFCANTVTGHIMVGGQVLDTMILDCMEHANRCSSQTFPEAVRILDELHSAMRFSLEDRLAGCHRLLRARARTELPAQPGYLFQPKHRAGGRLFGMSFISLAVQYGLVEYVRAKAEHKGLVRHLLSSRNKEALSLIAVPTIEERASWRRPLRLRAKLGRSGWAKSQGMDDSVCIFFPLLLDATCGVSPDPVMVKTLLSKGADPNLKIAMTEHRRQTTVWMLTLAGAIRFLSSSRVEYEQRARVQWIRVVGLMVRYGANIEKKVIAEAFRWDPGSKTLFIGYEDTRGWWLAVSDLVKELKEYKRNGDKSPLLLRSIRDAPLSFTRPVSVGSWVSINSTAAVHDLNLNRLDMDWRRTQGEEWAAEDLPAAEDRTGGIFLAELGETEIPTEHVS